MNSKSSASALPSWLRPSCWGRELRRNGLVAFVLVVGLLTLGFSFSALIYLVYASTGNAVTWRQAFSIGVTQWWLWSLLYVLVFRITRKLPFKRQKWLRGLFYLIFGLALTALKLAFDLAWIRFVYGGEVFEHISPRSLAAMMGYFNFVTYWVFVGVGQALNYYREVRAAELRSAQLEIQLAQAQLQTLRMELQPHFLFNTLHTISMLNLKDPRAANRMISRLSDLLRLTLDNSGAQEVPLKSEIDFLKQYLEIQQVRFQDRLSIGIDIDAQALDASVPNLILQPIVENAIIHGIADQEASGRIDVSASRKNGWLQLTVSDTGSGVQTIAPEQFKEGIGLANTRARLQQLFGDEHRFDLVGSNGGGLEVTITIPFRECAVSPTTK